MPAKKKAESEPQVQSEEVTPEVDENNPSEFQSHIKDGPTQDDLNPAYAPPVDEGADDGDDKGKDE